MRRYALSIALAITMAGCAKAPAPMPPLYPVTGTVVYKNGGAPAAGAITFQPITDTQMASSGTLASDGTFTIMSVRTSDQHPGEGAPEGEYRVTVFPAGSSDQTILPVDLPEHVKVKPGDNRFRFTIDKKVLGPGRSK